MNPIRGRLAVLWFLIGLMAAVYALSGCATTQPVRYECPQRLMQAWQFTYCMTGPYPWLVEATAEWCRWCCGKPIDVQRIVQRLVRLTLPVPCRVFDTDDDNDVDLGDFQEVQNER